MVSDPVTPLIFSLLCLGSGPVAVTMTPEQEALVGRVFESYVTEHHQDDLLRLVEDEDEEAHRPVVVNAMTLFEANMEVRTSVR